MSSGPTPSLISVVLATCNGERFLAFQLESVFAQTYPNLELVAVDDASTDGTWALLEQYASKHPNMRIFRNAERLGYVRNFEKACRLASGKWIALCDQDDYWLPQKLDKLAAAIGTADLIFCDSALCTENLQLTGARMSDRSVFGPLENCLQQAVVCRIYGHASLFSRRLLENALPFPEVLAHDWWLSFHATLGGGIRYLPESLVFYRQHSANVVGAIGEKSRKNNSSAKKLQMQREQAAQQRIELFYQACPEKKSVEKEVLRQLRDSYRGFDLGRSLRRMLLFFKYHHLFLSVKKRSRLRHYLFCLKMFWTVR